MRRMKQSHLQPIQRLPIHGPALRKHILVRRLLPNQVHRQRTQRAVKHARRTQLAKLDPREETNRVALLNGIPRRFHHGADKLTPVRHGLHAQRRVRSGQDRIRR